MAAAPAIRRKHRSGHHQGGPQPPPPLRAGAAEFMGRTRSQIAGVLDDPGQGGW